MITTTLSFNKNNTVFSQCISRLKGFILLYTAITFILVPLTTVINYEYLTDNVMLYSSTISITSILNILTFFDVFIEIFIATVLPVFMSMFIFKYLHNKNAVDFYHSLPVTRTSLLMCNFTCGYFAIAVPFILNYILKICIVFSAYKQLSVITMGLKNILIFCVFIFIIYAFCSLVAVSVGTTFESFGYSLAVCGAFSVIGIITTQFCSYLFGFAKENAFFENSFNLSPFGSVLSYVLNIDNLDIKIVLIWAVLAVLALFSANYIYKKRKSENADVAGRKNPLSILIRFIGSFCGGIILSLIFEFNIHLSFLACAVGGFLGYIIVEVIFAKGFATLKKSLVLSLISAVIMGGYGLFFQMGGFGFEARIPELSDIENVTISQLGIYRFPYSNDINSDVYGDLSMDYVLSSEESKKAILDVHQKILDHHFSEEEHNHNLGYEGFNVTYKLRGGKTISRRYYLYGNSEIQKAVAKLYDINEIKKASTFVFHTTSDIVNSVSISNKFGSYTQKINLTKIQIDELIEALQKDVLNKNYNNLLENKSNDYGTIDFSMTNNNSRNHKNKIISHSLVVSENDVNTISLLKKFGYYDVFSKGYEDIVSITLFAEENGKGRELIACKEFDTNIPNPFTPEYAILVNDDENIKSIVENSELYYITSEEFENSSVSFVVNYENGYSYGGNLRIKNIPLSVFENSEKLYTPKKKDIKGLINVLEETREYNSNISYVVDVYDSQMNEVAEKYGVVEPMKAKEEIILKGSNEDKELLYSTPAVYLYYLEKSMN